MSVGFFKATNKNTGWTAISYSEGLPYPGIKLPSPALQVRFFIAKYQRKTGVSN